MKKNNTTEGAGASEQTDSIKLNRHVRSDTGGRGHHSPEGQVLSGERALLKRDWQRGKVVDKSSYSETRTNRSTGENVTLSNEEIAALMDQ